MGRHNVIPTGIIDVRVYAPRTAAAVGNGLLNALIAYWPGNEAGGNLIDAHTNGLDLTETSGTIGTAAGLVYATARDYVKADSEYHGRNDEALLSIGNVDFTLACWHYMNTSQTGGIVCKDSTASNLEYSIAHVAGAASRFRFYVSSDGTSANYVVAESLGNTGISAWYLLVAWHDSVADTINIQVNNGTVDSVAHATGVFDGTSQLRIGRGSSAAFISGYADGRIGPTAFWKSAAGSGGALTAAQRTALYNAGAGLAYASFTA